MANAFKTNQLLRLALLLGAFFSANISPMRMTEKGKASVKRYLGLPSKEEINRKKGLLIFLDDSEKAEKGTFGALGGNLVTALYQEAGPIIVSTSLLYMLLELRRKDNRSTDKLMNELADENIILKETGDFILKKEYPVKSAIVASRIGLQEEQWIIKKINNSLNLLIPQSYLKSFGINRDEVEKYFEFSSLTSDVELRLGLKVNHMKTIDIKDISRPNEAQFADYFVDSLDTIFCTKSDYESASISIPEWFIYINGHGLLNHSIVWLSLDGFKKLLHFLENKIITQLLVVISCYAMGVNSEKIYGNMKSEIKSYYSFPIIVGGINNLPIGNYPPVVDTVAWYEYAKKQLTVRTNFANFLKRATTLNGEYEKIMEPLFTGYASMVFQIKMPRLEWFSILGFEEVVVSIGSALVKARDPENPLDVLTFFKKDPEIILLYTDDIPFELKINSNKRRAIFSMVSPQLVGNRQEPVVQRIKKISSPTHLFNILHWFITPPQFDQIFFIDEIGDYKDIVIFSTPYSLGSARAYFKNKLDVLYLVELESGKRTGRIAEEVDFLFNPSWSRKEYEEKMLEVRKQHPFEKITPEHIEKIKNVLTEQPAERQKKLKEAYTVSEPDVD
jgi:hypothetical protein